MRLKRIEMRMSKIIEKIETEIFKLNSKQFTIGKYLAEGRLRNESIEVKIKTNLKKNY